MTPPGLIVLAGLPGTGKSTIAAPLARRLHAAYLRIDTIEQALVDSGEIPNLQIAGYVTGYALACDQLDVGLFTVVECVNPLAITRRAWRHVAAEHASRLLEVELVCSDAEEHRFRVEHRVVAIPGLALPTWQQILDREYEPWDRDHLVIDTTKTSAEDAAQIIYEHCV